MEYHSFYGGRRGAPFIIKKSFPDIPSMTEAFRGGYSYLDVNFEEYAIIDNPYRLHPDNGKIFRRGYNFNQTEPIACWGAYKKKADGTINKNERLYNQSANFYCGDQCQYVFITTNAADSDYWVHKHGAEYVGQIQGPPGPIPTIKLDKFETIRQKQERLGQEGQQYELNVSEESALVPGKRVDGDTGEDIIEKTIDIRWVHDYAKDFREGDLLLGFKIPYLVTEFEAERVNPYTEPTATLLTTEVDTQGNDQSPFYKLWRITIPQGYHGVDPRNLRVSTFAAENADGKTVKNHVVIGTDNGKYIWQEAFGNVYYPGTNTPVTQTDAIIVYDTYTYEDHDSQYQWPNGKLQETWYIGVFRQLKDISVDDNGSLILKFTAGNDHTLTPGINTGAFEGQKSQKVQLKFKDEDGTEKTNEFGDPLNYVMELQVTSDRHLIALYSDPARRQAIIDNNLDYHIGKPQEQDDINNKTFYRKIPDIRDKQTHAYAGWQDVATLGHDQGILIGAHLTQADLQAKHGDIPADPDLNIEDVQQVVQRLNKLYPEGFYMPDEYDGDKKAEYEEMFKYKVINVAYSRLNAKGVPYDATSSYNVGDYVVKDNKIYQCIAPVAANEEWDASKWKEIGEKFLVQNFYAFSYVFDDTPGSENTYRGWFYLGSISSDRPQQYVILTKDDSAGQPLKSGLAPQGLWFKIDTYYTITYELANGLTSSNTQTIIRAGDRYTTTIQGSADNLVVGQSTINGVSFQTAGMLRYWSNNTKVLDIPEVTGDLVIKVTK